MKWNDIQIRQLKSYVAALKPTWAGRLFYHFLPFRKKTVLKNMRLVFDSILSASEIKKLALCHYSHFATSIKEALLMQLMSFEQIKQKAEVHIHFTIPPEEKGAIFLTGHFGNSEFAPIAALLHFKKYKKRFYFLRRPITNKFTNNFLFARYYKAGLEIISKKNSLEKVCAVLEQNNFVVFVMDQHACLKAKDGIAVDFFGKKAGTFKSLAMIAGHMNVPVCPARSYRRKSDGKHVIEFFPPLPWLKGENAQDEIVINTRRYNEILEKFVLDYPEQWHWTHRRWRDE